MKKTLLTLALVLASTQVQAASLESCLRNVISNCIDLAGVTTSQIDSLSRGTECKIIQGGKRETDGTRYAEKTIFFDSNTIISVETDRSALCRGSAAQIRGAVTDSAAKDGRLYMAHNSGALIAVGRDNNIFEVLNSSGDSYKSIVGVKIEGSELVLQRERNQQTRLSLEQLTKRLNQKSKVRCLSASCN